jgi:hypothetical protein
METLPKSSDGKGCAAGGKDRSILWNDMDHIINLNRIR